MDEVPVLVMSARGEGAIINKQEAIAEIKRVQNGGGVDRDAFAARVPRGRIAVELWDDEKFVFGIEYGYIIALMTCFGIGREDLNSPAAENDKAATKGEGQGNELRI